MKIGYFITACNEYDELAKLLVLLRTNILKTDCIGILLDEDNCTEEVQGLCNQFLIPDDSAFRVIYSNLNKDFASFKNLGYHLFEDCDWIFNIDADELPSSILLKNIHQIIDVNPETELFYVPRINTVEGLLNLILTNGDGKLMTKVGLIGQIIKEEYIKGNII